MSPQGPGWVFAGKFDFGTFQTLTVIPNIE